MEAKRKSRATRDTTSETRPDAGAYVTPEIVAAENGEQVEFGTTIEYTPEDVQED